MIIFPAKIKHVIGLRSAPSSGTQGERGPEGEREGEGKEKGKRTPWAFDYPKPFPTAKLNPIRNIPRKQDHITKISGTSQLSLGCYGSLCQQVAILDHDQCFYFT